MSTPFSSMTHTLSSLSFTTTRPSAPSSSAASAPASSSRCASSRCFLAPQGSSLTSSRKLANASWIFTDLGYRSSTARYVLIALSSVSSICKKASESCRKRISLWTRRRQKRRLARRALRWARVICAKLFWNSTSAGRGGVAKERGR